MQHTLNKLKITARKVRLSADEKTLMRGRLLRYVKAHPAKHDLVYRRSGVLGIPSPFSITDFRNKRSLSILTIGALLVGSSTSFAAENTVPGDVLYPVKTHVNETVRGAVALSPQAKAAWEVRLVERRLEEVEKLAVTPAALPEVKEMAQANLATYTSNVQKRIERFEADEDGEDALVTAHSLSSVLREHEDALTLLAGHAGATTTPLSVASTADASTSTSTTIASSVSTTTPPVSVAHNDVASLIEVLSGLRAARSHAEEKHQELERKYHPQTEEVKADDSTENNDTNDSVQEDAPLVLASKTVLSRVVQIFSTSTIANGTSTVAVATTTSGTTTSPVISGFATSTVPETNGNGGYQIEHHEETTTAPEVHTRGREHSTETRRAGSGE